MAKLRDSLFGNFMAFVLLHSATGAIVEWVRRRCRGPIEDLLKTY